MVIAFVGGVVLGVFFFGGLYWTVRQFERARNPALLMIASLVVRMLILLIGFYYLMDGDYRNLLTALVGLLLVRFVMIMNTKKKIHPPDTNQRKE